MKIFGFEIKKVKPLFENSCVLDKENREKARQDNTRLSERDYKRITDNGLCPNCGGTLLAGPCGGMCQNVMCKDCGSKFNITPFGVDRI